MEGDHPSIRLPGDATPRRVWFQEMAVAQIYPNSSNRAIYDGFNSTHHDDRRLMDSIKASGLLEPPTVFPTGLLVSGHRRVSACRALKLQTIRCRVIEGRPSDDPEVVIRQLREFNVSRDKTILERAREEIVDVDKAAALRALAADRIQRRQVTAAAMDLGEEKQRSKIGKRKRPFLNAIKAVVESLREFWPISLRSIHYKLVSDPNPIIVDTRDDRVYANDKMSSKKLSELATRARILGEIPLNAIEDETRAVSLWQTHESPQHFLKTQMADFLSGYQRNYLQTQPHHIEVVCEKLALKNILEPICGKYTLPLTIGRGHSSIPPRWEIVKRYRRSGKEKLILLMLGDFDPDGIAIAEAFPRSLRDDFNVTNIHAVRVGLNQDQIDRYNLPTSLEAKPSSVNYKKFVKKHGTAAYELDALDPATLQSVLEDAIAEVLDVDAFNREVDAEREDAASIAAMRRAVMKSIGDAELFGGH